MWCKRILVWLIGGLAVSAQEPVLAQAPAAAGAHRSRLVAAARPFAGYRRYRGTVGGRAVVVELTTADGFESNGRLCYEARPNSCRTLRTPAASLRKLQLRETAGRNPSRLVARWTAQQPAGPLLTGVRISASGHRLPFKLRENYFDRQGRLQAVPFELVKGVVEKIYLGRGDTIGQEAQVVLDSLRRTKPDSSQIAGFQLPDDLSTIDIAYLHLLTPDTVKQPLHDLQCPGPVARRLEAEAALRQLGNHRGIESTRGLAVVYLGHGLLQLETSWSSFFQGAVAFGHSAQTTLYDLRTGRQFTAGDLLRAGTTARLNYLIRQVKRRTHRQAEDLILSADDFRIAETGIYFPVPESTGYVENDSEALLMRWAELRPLLRPDSPVARMLRERGLWAHR